MARIQIAKKDGTPTPYFWMEKDGVDRTHQPVYKQTTDGIRKMRGVHFNVSQNKIKKEQS